jgi:hypothetical protein
MYQEVLNGEQLQYFHLYLVICNCPILKSLLKVVTLMCDTCLHITVILIPLYRNPKSFKNYSLLNILFEAG